jgi:hypothetical protein
MSIILVASKAVLLLALIVLALLLARTSQLEWGSDQRVFAQGTADTLPTGLYAGSVPGPEVSWLGKSFDSGNASGVNNFKAKDGTTVQKYPFTLSLGSGVHDRQKVVRIDYDLPANPWWLRPILDEIVLIAPHQYLGKLQFRIIPGYPFTLTYFRLSQNT